MTTAKHKRFLLLKIAVMLQLAAVGCRGFGDFQAAPPSGFSYSGSPFVITVNTAMPAAKPQITGTVSACLAEPALPAGLQLGQSDCVLSGVPTVIQPPTGYTITASNKTGSTATTISIEVNANPPASLVYTGSPFAFTQGNSIAPLTPTFTGSVTTCASAPPLPPGLSINNSTCEITGIPTIAQVSTAYTITATNAFGSTNTGINIAITAETTPPSAPTALNATPISGAQIDLTWTAATDNFSAQGNLIYEICRATASGGCTTFTVTHTTGAGAVNFSSAGLSAGTVYYFVVRARDEANNLGAISGEASAMTTPAGSVSNPVLAPAPGLYNITQNVSATVAAPASSTVCYSTNGVDPACDGTKLACSSGTLYSVAVAVSATSTFKAVGCKPTYLDSAVTTGTYTFDYVAPSTPAPFNASPVSMTQIDLTWSAASDDLTPPGNIVYEICRATTSGGCGTFTATHTTAAGATNFSVTGLTGGTTYYFVIRSRDQATNLSTVSGEISAMTTPVGTVSNPVFTPPAGTYNSSQNVTITVASPASPTICYSTNGVDPSCDALTKLICTSGTSYSGPVAVAGGQTLKAIGCKLTYADSAVTAGTYTVDSAAPTVTGVTASTTDGTYNSGATISIQVVFSEPVNVTGTPVLSLATGNPATTPVNYVSGTGTNTLTFDYVVANGNTTGDLDYVSTAALAGGTIQDAVGNNAVLTLATPGAANSLGASKAIVVNPPPGITSVTPTNGATNWPVTSPVTINFNQNMNTGLINAQGANGACSGTVWVSTDNFASCLGGTMAYPTQSSATFTPSNPFCVEGNYPIRVRILTAVQSAYGVPLPTPYDAVHGFTTQQALMKTAITTGTDVRALAISCNTLFVGGSFSQVTGSLGRNNLVAIDLATGFPLNGGFTPPAFGTNGAVNALAINGNELIVGGSFTNAGSGGSQNLAAFNIVTGAKSAWSPAPNAAVNALAVDSGIIYAGGSFTLVDGSVSRNKLAAFTAGVNAPNAWNPSSTAPGAVNAIAIAGSTAIIGGAFTGGTVGGNSRNYLAAVDASTGAGGAYTGWCTAGADLPVNTIAASGGNVYFGGSFNGTCGITFYNFGAVSASTGGSIGFANGSFTGANDVVSALFVDNAASTLYVGGAFNTATDAFIGTTRNFMGSTGLTGNTANAWHPNFNGSVLAITKVGTAVVVGGLFTTVNGGTAANRLAIVETSTGTLRP
ncbi:putative Ig domain-containing protein [Turneriella parva]|uniref:Fibronectin type III domain protein n=1 Tax=Turneriella parva (strain ATCC BAA-1111 / DSM 21527 / NCTC 11395 / H) TaxID=869212 RepID=I4B4S5_TURPD|nr:putative Ig domain-containing protein [Turneriella parva]AFM12282.1 Fibronectin type III domain protein [Turneriella parva DSM 21527]